MGFMRKFLRLLYQPYKFLVLIPLTVLATCFFVLLGVVIVFLFNDRVAHRTTGVWWSRLISCITPIRVKGNGNRNKKNMRGFRPRDQELMRTISLPSIIGHSQAGEKVSARTAVLSGPGGRNNIRILAGL